MNRNDAMWSVLRRCDDLPTQGDERPGMTPIERIQLDARMARTASFYTPLQYRFMLEVIAARCLLELEKFE